MVLSVQVHTATFAERNTLVVTEDVAGVTLAALHTGGWREVAEDGKEVRAGGRTGDGAI